MRIEIKSRTIPYQFTLPNGHVLFKIEEATLAHETFTGGMTSEITRVNFERGDGVGVLLYAQDTDEVVLIEQFRYPVYASGSEPESDRKGWLIEIVAGIKDADGQPGENSSKKPDSPWPARSNTFPPSTSAPGDAPSKWNCTWPASKKPMASKRTPA